MYALYGIGKDVCLSLSPKAGFADHTRDASTNWTEVLLIW